MAINIQFRVIVPASGVVQCPNVAVPTGATVYVRGHNGAALGNSGPVYVARDRDDAAAGAAGTRNTVVNANTQVGFPVENTGQIYVAGAVGDGAVISILK